MITTWSRGEPDGFMPEAILTELSSLIRRHPWWQARTRLVLSIIDQNGISPPARVLDAGCGWGVTLEALEARGYRVCGLDVSRQALERLDRPDSRLIEADLTCPLGPGAAAEAAFDVVLALDVIEHLDDDGAALTSLGRLLRPGGTMIVSVPALPELFSEFDQVQGHRRRYLPDDFQVAFDRHRPDDRTALLVGELARAALSSSRTELSNRADRSNSGRDLPSPSRSAPMAATARVPARLRMGTAARSPRENEPRNIASGRRQETATQRTTDNGQRTNHASRK